MWTGGKLTYHNRPTNQRSLNETTPQNRGVKKQRKRSKQQFKEILVCFSSIERQQTPCKTDFRRKRLLRGQGPALHISMVFLKRRRTTPIRRPTITWRRCRIRHLVSRVISMRFLLEVCLPSDIGVEAVGTTKCSLGDEEDDERESDAGENGDEVERPLPADCVGDLADDDRGEEGAAEEGHV